MATRFKVDLPVKALFESPTIAKVAGRLVIDRTMNNQDLSGILDEIESLSDEEIHKNLRDKNDRWF